MLDVENEDEGVIGTLKGLGDGNAKSYTFMLEKGRLGKNYTFKLKLGPVMYWQQKYEVTSWSSMPTTVPLTLIARAFMQDSCYVFGGIILGIEAVVVAVAVVTCLVCRKMAKKSGEPRVENGRSTAQNKIVPEAGEADYAAVTDHAAEGADGNATKGKSAYIEFDTEPGQNLNQIQIIRIILHQAF